MDTARNTIVRLLRNIGTRSEVEQYLRQFSSVESKRFAVIKVGGAVLQRDLDGLASSLTFLNQVGLFPIVLHGAAPQIDEALMQAGISTPRIDGLRKTPSEALEVVRKVLQRENLRLVEALENLGTRARPILSSVFDAEPVDRERLGFVGAVTKVNVEAIESSIRAGHLPILACLGESASGQILNLNADVAVSALAQALSPFKIVLLNETGGLLDEQGQVIPAINLVEDYAALLEQAWVSPEMRRKIHDVKQLLDRLPENASVSITSPDHLAKELFTHKGSGTLLRRGERVDAFDDVRVVDKDRLRSLIEGCFGRQLDPDYFKKKKFFRVYLSGTYRGTAILTREKQIPYLDKFAVTTEAQGAGIGGSIWSRLVRDHAKLYWRSRANNPVNAWYFERAQGSYMSGDWRVFWYGLEGFAEVQRCVEHALSLPPTLADPKVEA